MVTPTKVTFEGVANTDLGCAADADCYKALGGLAAATTDADKKKRCCMFWGVSTAPSGVNQSVGDAEILSLTSAYGLPTTAGEATKYCQPDYPTYIANLKVNLKGFIMDSPTNVIYKKFDDTGELLADRDSGNYEAKTYCDGSASAL